MVEISAVRRGSPADQNHILPGDILISINENPIHDVLDYRFYLTEKKVTLKIHRGAELFDVTIKKDEYDDIGLDFETFLMDEKKQCTNKCIFCFIDQMPRGMRDTLYFKDDDSRLSFLMGNYVTLTNFKDADVDRIIEMHMSPIRISVHTTEPALRVTMMKNRFAGEALKYLDRFFEAGIQMECQIVLCRGYNDGAHLEKTMTDLAAYIPAVESVAVVPAGLTAHRDGLCRLEPFSPVECRAVVEQVEAFGAECLKNHGQRTVFASDEFYLKAGLPIPDGDFYEDYPQIENGVGMLASMLEEFDDAIEDIADRNPEKKRVCSIATGEAAYPFISGLVGRLETLCPGLTCHIYPIRNDFFGHEITVAGLVTGGDLMRQLKGKELGERLILPSVMLRHEADKFLDDVTPAEVSAALGVPVFISETDGMSFIDGVLYE